MRKTFYDLHWNTFLLGVVYLRILGRDIEVSKNFYHKHEIVNHEVGYVSSTGVNTNQIESAWKHIRRTFRKHIKVSKHNIHLYAKEAAYKFNKIPSFETIILCLI
ncbi:hypothetical protein SAP269_19750 [Spiroplasma ixodetis]|uniref:ISXO2-like transposase domain-containing protein n=1 Tax=Spiroplasma ixodetis TaxID=2141 RepID=A0ABM8JPY6_9MOLU